MYGLIQGFGLLLGLVLVTQSEAEDVIMLLNQEIWIEMLGSSGSCCIRDSTSLVKENQSIPLQDLPWNDCLVSGSVVDDDGNW